MADNSILPRMRWVYSLHHQLLEDKLGYGDDNQAYNKAKDLVDKFNEDCFNKISSDDKLQEEKYGDTSHIPFAKISKSPEGETVVVLVDNFMRR